MSEKEIVKYAGANASVQWDGRICIHVGECGRATGDLFVAGRQPWCQPDLAELADAIDVVERCPTGAITLAADGDGPCETADDENTVAVAVNGPLFVRGDLEIEGAATDMPGVKFRAALCRCGQSKNKPFCDNSHQAAGFEDYGAVGDSGPGTEPQGGKLQVKLAKDGPLLVSGNLRITNGSARTAWSGKQVALCRCGESANKPFCDGAHKAAGFKSD